MSGDYKHVPTDAGVELVDVQISSAAAADSKELVGATDYLELTLSLNAPDKVGVAWQLGGLLALQAVGLLKHVRHIDGSGMSNLMIAQWIRGSYLVSEHKFSVGKWTDTCGGIEETVVKPVINRLLLVDQERCSILKRIVRPWQWFKGWHRAFGMWLEDWLPERRLLDAMQSVETKRDQKNLPIFTMSAYDTVKKKALVLTTEKEPIKTGDDEAGMYPRCLNFAEVDPIAFLVGSAVGTGSTLELAMGEWADLECALPVDPMVSKPSDMHWVGYRAPVTAGLDSGRRIVLDAYTGSQASQGSIPTAFAESASSNLTLVPVGERKDALRDFKTPAALYKEGYVRMHSHDAGVRGMSFLKEGLESYGGLVALTRTQIEHYMNWGYSQTFARFSSQRLSADALPFPKSLIDGML